MQLSEQRFRKVFDHSRIGMALTDPSGRFLRVNPAMCQMLGYPEGQLVGRHSPISVTPTTPRSVSRGCATALPGASTASTWTSGTGMPRAVTWRRR
ncbi:MULTISPECIES: PAS domain S-box protein [Micromonospora]|uniref:PAS domain S-box protein n=1 Tax=Micromonospora TaxID=1873 RepID=UPI0009E4646F